jgi:hypothetical protein
LDVREHQPVKVAITKDKQLDGRVAKTVNPGLGRTGRIVQQARVEVFKVSE